MPVPEDENGSEDTGVYQNYGLPDALDMWRVGLGIYTMWEILKEMWTLHVSAPGRGLGVPLELSNIVSNRQQWGTGICSLGRLQGKFKGTLKMR